METAANKMENTKEVAMENETRQSTFTDLIQPHLKDYCPASNLAFNEKVKRLIADGQKVYHLGFGQSPFPILDGAVKKLQQHANENAYLPVQGLPELRSKICEFHRKLDGLTHLKPDNVIIAPGSKELIYLLLAVFNGDVLVLSPTWTTYKPQSQLAHHKAVVIQTTENDDWRVTPENIEKVISENNLLLILCNPDNPSKELTSVGITAVMPTAGYYIFPNFEILRSVLAARGITTGTQMCDTIFDEVNVALMSGGPAFLRPGNEFTVRLCFINFDGTEALKASKKLGTEKDIDDEFLKQYCLTTVEAIQALKKWVKDQLETGSK
ncbi:aspartate aminotransferase-like [Saccoglossus kowalevskii]|uniref:Bifunctional aspartate aminotransferase and glutamate/aspartate-prephenate aminotransferase-like n=1 Tax=Saccoglossus kowalevskii TaxID=10224 RepID=A0ABM0MAN8_SACKO|nr:PREDICTED: bifunctional aspartate aminotransferase and glutamate/aspartate-prephenate aminotransferase-like [Saccoglossus kowalevskii]